MAKIIEKLRDALGVFRISKEAALRFFALLGIFIIAFIIRAYPIIKYGISLRAYDPFVQYQLAMLIEKHGLKVFFNDIDFYAWYPWGRAFKALYLGIPLTALIIYKLILFFGFQIDLLTVATFIPAIFGSLTVFAVYGIAREIKSERAALFAAFLVAISPGMIQRTLAGFFDNESVGVFLIMLILWLFILASKRGSVLFSLLAGLALGFLGLTWGVYRYVFGLLALYVLVLILSDKLDNNTALAYSLTMSIGLGITTILPRNYGILLGIDGLLPLGVLILVIIQQLGLYLSQILAGGRREAYIKITIGGLILISLGILYLYVTGQLGALEAKFASVINPALREGLPAFSSVSENQPASWGVIFMGAFLATIFAPIGLYYAIEKRGNTQLLFVIMILTGFYFSASISRYIVVGAPLLAIGAGVGIDYILDPFARALRGEWIIHRIKPVRVRLGEQRLPRGEAAVAYLLIAFLLTLSIYNGVTVTKAMSGYDIDPDELYVFQYLKTHASPTDVVLSWWDYGYRLRVYGNVTVLVDNGTVNTTQMGVVGSMLMLPEEKSIRIMRKYNVKYVVVYMVDILKAIWMIRIAEKHAPQFNVTEKDYFNKKEGKYKEPFFHSVLWRLITFQEAPKTVTSWVTNYGEKALQDRAADFIPTSLMFFKLLVRSPNGRVKLYKVLYRSYITAPQPPLSKNSTSSQMNSTALGTIQKPEFKYDPLSSLLGKIEVHVLYIAPQTKETHISYNTFLRPTFC